MIIYTLKQNTCGVNRINIQKIKYIFRSSVYLFKITRIDCVFMTSRRDGARTGAKIALRKDRVKIYKGN